MAAKTTKVKEVFSKADLKKWRSLLVAVRREKFEDIKDLMADVTDCEDGHTLPTHQADRGFDSELQEMSIGNLDNEEELLWMIDRAISKIETSIPYPFGLCEITKKPIPKNRLKLLPWNPFSVEGSQYCDDNGLLMQEVLDSEEVP